MNSAHVPGSWIHAAVLAVALPLTTLAQERADRAIAEEVTPSAHRSRDLWQPDRTPGSMRRESVLEALRAYDGPRIGLQPSGQGGGGQWGGCDQVVDNFDDGNLDGWATYSFAPGASAALVQNGRLLLTRPAGGDKNPWQWFGVTNAGSVNNQTYYDGSIRLTFRINQEGNMFVASARGFLAAFVVQYWKGQYYLIISDWDGIYAFHSYAKIPIALEIGTDYRLEGTFVGPDLSMKVWKATDPEPAAPQLQAVSPQWGDPYLKKTDISVEMDGQFTNIARSVEVDDITFCPLDGPEPPTIDPNTIPVTGIPVPRLARFDELVRQYMALTHTQSAVLSYMLDGKMQFHRAYGWADEAHTVPLQPDAMMRLASISKPFAAAAVRELVAQHKLRMTDHAFNLGQKGGGILDIQPYPSLGDPRYADITVQNLVEHTTGWDRGIYGDVNWCEFKAAEVLGLTTPLSRRDRMRYILSTPLQHNPGEEGLVDGYSNAAYDALGLIVEQVSGMPLDDYVHLKVLPKLRVDGSETEIGRTHPADFNPREPFYGCYASSPDMFNPDPHGPWVRVPYGGYVNEALSSLAGRIASAPALLGLGAKRWLFGENAGKELPNRLPPDFFDVHSGSMPGTDTALVHGFLGGDLVTCWLSNRSAPEVYFDEALNDGLSAHGGKATYVTIARGEITWPARRTGDMNCDGHVNDDDVDPFFLAVSDIDAYAAAYPDCTGFNADTNGDLKVDAEDIPGFLALVKHAR